MIKLMNMKMSTFSLLFLLTVICINNTHASDSDDKISAPTFKRKLIPFVVKPAGSMMRLKCPFNGNPTPNITWYKDGKTPITRTLSTVRYSSSFITLEDLEVNDTGKYTCNVCNIMGCINFTYTVEIIQRVHHLPIIVEAPKNQTVIYGQNCSFTCEYLSDLHSICSWSITYNNSTKKLISNSKSPNLLQLHNVTFDDEGLYTCIAENSLGKTEATAYLKVIPEPEKLEMDPLPKYYNISTFNETHTKHVDDIF